MEATPRFELGNQSFADSCLTTWLCRHILKYFTVIICVILLIMHYWAKKLHLTQTYSSIKCTTGADDGARTRYLHLGKVALYQMSYIRIFGASGRNRTIDTGIFSPLLYRLSYRGKFGDPERARTVDL